MFIRRPTILVTSADLRQLRRQSSHANPNQCYINTALINAHLYIISVTSVGVGLWSVSCQECVSEGWGCELCVTGSFAVPQQELLCGCHLTRQFLERVICIPGWWWSSRIEAPCHVGFSHLYMLHFSLHKISWQSSSGKMLISWGFIRITLIMNSDYIHLILKLYNWN